MPAARHQYQFLDSLIGGWFHQDFDIDGNTPAEIIEAYNLKASSEERAAVQRDIRRFLADHPDDARITRDFMDLFQPDLIEEPWGLSTRQFLTRIDELLG